MSYICFNFIFFLVLAYTLYLYSYSQHGSIYFGVYSCSLGYVREFLLLFLHWFPLNLIWHQCYLRCNHWGWHILPMMVEYGTER